MALKRTVERGADQVRAAGHVRFRVVEQRIDRAGAALRRRAVARHARAQRFGERERVRRRGGERSAAATRQFGTAVVRCRFELALQRLGLARGVKLHCFCSSACGLRAAPLRSKLRPATFGRQRNARMQ